MARLGASGGSGVSGEYVLAPGNGQTDRIIYAESLSVASGALTTIITHTAALGFRTILQRVEVSGENYANFQVLINGAPISNKRTNVTNLNATFDYATGNDSGFLVNVGDVITVTVLHNRPWAGNFESSIQFLEI